MRRIIPATILLFLVSCSNTPSGTVGDSVATTAATATAASSPSPTLEPTPAPTAEPPAEVEVVGFVQVGNELSVRLKNPNDDVGLVRSGFELALLDADGGILAVEGSAGLPGAACCTIYRLPPGGEFGLSTFVPEGKVVDSIELTVLGDWHQWDSLNPAFATVSNESVQADSGFGGPIVTGRVAIDQPGPFNVWVVAFVETPDGVVVAAGSAECVTDAGPRAFEVRSFAQVRGPYTLGKVMAYPTTVEGVGGSFTPDC